jgi:hypothetical protein
LLEELLRANAAVVSAEELLETAWDPFRRPRPPATPGHRPSRLGARHRGRPRHRTRRARLDPGPAKVRGDSVLLAQLVHNLVDNAVAHSVPGGWLAVRTKSAGTTSCLEIGNGGPRMDDQLADQLFEPFQRLCFDRADPSPATDSAFRSCGRSPRHTTVRSPPTRARRAGWRCGSSYRRPDRAADERMFCRTGSAFNLRLSRWDDHEEGAQIVERSRQVRGRTLCGVVDPGLKVADARHRRGTSPIRRTLCVVERSHRIRPGGTGAAPVPPG